MTVEKFIDCIFKAQRPQSELDELIAHVERATRLSGDANIVEEFEQALCDYFGVQYAIAVSSGTAALHASLAETIQQGDEVLLPIVGVPMTAAAILQAGGVPVFYDISPNSFAPDMNDIQRLDTGKIKAVITVPMWGYSAMSDELLSYANEREWVTIEDTAQALGTRVGDAFEGTRGDIGCFSTHEFKLLSTGEGGFVLTNNPIHAARIREFTHIGFSTDAGGFGFRSGLNYKLSALQAALGQSQLSRLEQKIADRNEKIQFWRRMLGIGSTSRLRDFDSGRARHNGYSLALVLKAAAPGEARDISRRLFEANINTDIHRYKQSYLVNYPMLRPYYQAPRYSMNSATDFPNATGIINSLIVLPCHDEITAIDIEIATSRIQSILI